MRVAYCIDSLARGGAEQSLALMAGPLVASGVELHVGYLKPDHDLAAALETAGARVTFIGGETARVRMSRLNGWVRATNPELLHTTLLEADLLGRLVGFRRRVPCVSSLVNSHYGAEHRDNSPNGPARVVAAQGLDLLTGKLVRAFHAVSASVATTMAKRLLIPRSSITVVPRGRDSSIMGRRTAERRQATRAALNLPAEALVGLCVGRLDRQKGIDTAIDATLRIQESLPQFQLLVAGRDGPHAAEIRAHGAERHGVRFLGDRGDVADLMVAADVLVFPSRWEGMPGTVIEALALELPIVASNIPTNAEVLPPDIGDIVQVDSAGELADTVVRRLSATAAENACRSAMGRSRFEENYSIEVCAARMKAFYESALKR